ncbi:MAG: xanthine dehydrogenase family protein molybdopterin-binding subunit [Candidatus Parabeggiatoa sp. nov. 1]|nr:MAG: xanthine dehydrogenase family protein molybdopterin-binding subunit [Gammaproteobacteria bacterium]
MDTLNVSRRNFLKSTATVAGGLIIGFHLPHNSRLAQAAETTETAINAWLRIGTDDSVTVMMAHSEMGQGVHTSLPMLVAEELEADWRNIQIETSPIGGVYQNPAMGMQITGGSTSVRLRWEMLRTAGAAAREVLIEAAAQQWQVQPENCRAALGKVIHTNSGQTLSYGQLAEAAAKLMPPDSPKLKSPSEFKIIGQPIKRLDTPAKVDGSAIFGIDVKVPNMLIATVKQSPVFGGKVKQYDEAAAKAIAGVKAVVEIPNGVAVVAENYWQAKKGVEALNVSFAETEHDKQDTASITKLLEQGLTENGAVARNTGDAQAALKTAKTQLTAEYSVPFLAHVTMEPMNCTADVKTDSCEVWVGTQAQEWVQQTAAKVTGLPKEKIAVHTTYLGGGFGRRVELDFVTQAVLLSKTVRQPVKLIWAREEDTQHDFYRPAMRVKFTAGLDEKGMPTAIQTRVVGPSILQRVFPGAVKNGLDSTAVEGIADMRYEIPNQYTDYVMKNTHVPVGFWRSVGHSHNAFFLESFIDEIAHASGKNPYHLRRTLLSKSPRFLKVLDTLVWHTNCDQPAPKGYSRGIAIHHSFGSIVGEVAEVSVSEAGKVTVHRVVCVVDCGIVVNPDTVKAQMESAIVYGLSALKEAITLKNGRVEQSNFHDFPVLKMAEMPQIEVVMISNEEKLGGVGEPGTPPIIPAVTNAIFAATGKRLRHLPIDHKESKL